MKDHRIYTFIKLHKLFLGKSHYDRIFLYTVLLAAVSAIGGQPGSENTHSKIFWGQEDIIFT